MHDFDIDAGLSDDIVWRNGAAVRGGITPGIRRTFVVYLARHNRPMHEVRFPALRSIPFDYT